MTAFQKDRFNYYGMWVHYITEDGERKFVARFKYRPVEKRMINFIIKNFTVEEYFGLLEAGEPPLRIVESKGYLCNVTRKVLRQNGFPLTWEGYEQYKAWNRERHYA